MTSASLHEPGRFTAHSANLYPEWSLNEHHNRSLQELERISKCETTRDVLHQIAMPPPWAVRSRRKASPYPGLLDADMVILFSVNFVLVTIATSGQWIFSVCWNSPNLDVKPKALMTKRRNPGNMVLGIDVLGMREMRDECVLWGISLNVIAMPRTRGIIMKFNVVRGRSIVIRFDVLWEGDGEGSVG